MEQIDRNETRPDIETISSADELRRWYWRKDELVTHARHLGLKTTSGKFTILDRIAHYLSTGETIFPGDIKPTVKSRFDWHSERLSRDTVITDSYKNSQNVRRFFIAEIGDNFKFNIAFMDWIRTNIGKTLGDACSAFRDMQKLQKDVGFRTDIKSHNQFNQFTRDFLDDNPELNMDNVRRIWALKIALPSNTGRHVYAKSDLDLDKKA